MEWSVSLGAIITMIMVVIIAIERINSQLEHINNKLNKITKHLGLDECEIDEDLKKLIAEGKKIKAIKRYREHTGVGLKEAKDYIDSL
ncbi:Ribosomal protein L7/L12 C-terminal domain-containing protein [Hathewaya proteolytica DSM 3090]|uniref:Ribosomal protein L7/L12 C-terminal domain-containing protein n=1 Tax=Hathewaya proteolytica DSM 3090 TaxID=1121331 RepID=A0A1M6QJ10_9CLOT|nr:ribosomal protein L7/L12 [Hathewaya proteolytica]SHK20231.1 Ribosomal protein L7/L12 C-terminal domain-containing protein [Hathewaya proteolytica DSM 3090]